MVSDEQMQAAAALVSDGYKTPEAAAEAFRKSGAAMPPAAR